MRIGIQPTSQNIDICMKGKEMLGLTLLSLGLTAAFLLFAFYQSRAGKTVVVEEVQKDGEEKKGGVERHNLWYYLGFVDDTPNLIRQVIAGNKKNGRPVRYIANLQYGTIDRYTGKIKRRKNPPLEKEGWLFDLIRVYFGKRWCRVPLIQHIKMLTIDRVVSKDTKSTGGQLADELEAESVSSGGLY